MQDEYYNKIKENLIDVEVTERVKNYTANRVKLEKYYEIGRLIFEAQGGEERRRRRTGRCHEKAGTDRAPAPAGGESG
jgi:hypothetical protein